MAAVGKWRFHYVWEEKCIFSECIKSLCIHISVLYILFCLFNGRIYISVNKWKRWTNNWVLVFWSMISWIAYESSKKKPVNDKTECWHLARSIWNYGVVQIPIFRLKQPCLESRKRDANSQINFLPCIDSIGLILVRLDQIIESVSNIMWRNC